MLLCVESKDDLTTNVVQWKLSVFWFLFAVKSVCGFVFFFSRDFFFSEGTPS